MHGKFVVVKKETGEKISCHVSHAKAVAAIAAIENAEREKHKKKEERVNLLK